MMNQFSYQAFLPEPGFIVKDEFKIPYYVCTNQIFKSLAKHTTGDPFINEADSDQNISFFSIHCPVMKAVIRIVETI